MKTIDLFANAPCACKKLHAEAKKAKRLKERKAFMKRLQEDLPKR